jgi:hypothetical protein
LHGGSASPFFCVKIADAFCAGPSPAQATNMPRRSVSIGTRLAGRPVVNKLLRGCALVLNLVACSATPDRPPQSDIVPARATYPVTIVTPLVLQGLPMGPSENTGALSVTPCGTCHADVDDSPLPDNGASLKGPHAGLQVQHGHLHCAACHDASHRDRLHLADGRDLSLTQAMDLCAQCHGPQKRDYDHGAHGGMRGAWDLTTGPRERNHCVACHDPHAPAFGKFAPVEGPRDRFAAKAEVSHGR